MRRRYIKEKKRRRIRLVLLMVTIVIGIFSFGFYQLDTQPKKSLLSPLAQTQEKRGGILNSFENKPGITPVIENALLNSQGTYSVIFIDLQTGERSAINEHQTYPSASLYKLWVMGTTYDQLTIGKLTEETLMTTDVKQLYETFPLASDEARLQDEIINLTVGEALHRMITYSDNDAALLLTQEVGFRAILDYLQKHNLSESHMGGGDGLPETTAHDSALFLQKLYKKELADEINTEKMLALLKQQQLNGKIPRYLPAEVVIAHKTGELDEYTHDAGIIYTPAGNYILVVMARSSDRANADEQISRISQAVYEYVTQK